jgi:hypothetical protein
MTVKKWMRFCARLKAYSSQGQVSCQWPGDGCRLSVVSCQEEDLIPLNPNTDLVEYPAAVNECIRISQQ